MKGNKTIRLIVPQTFQGQRLDRFLTVKLSKFSRSFFKDLANKKLIQVNNKIAKASQRLKKGDKIVVNLKPETRKKIQSEKIKLDIIYQDKDVVIINKPAFMLVHPDAYTKSGTLVNALLDRYPKIKNVGQPHRPGIVHRLDKETSGLIVCAKTNTAYKYLIDQFKKRKIIKKYLALVYGLVKRKRGIIVYLLGQKRKKQAETAYRVLKYFRKCKVKPGYKQDYTFLEIKPKTGRLHQIRLHFAKVGHPVVGDKKYKFKGLITPPSLKRHFLHAFFLKLRLPSNKLVEFKIKLPKDLKAFLDQLSETEVCKK